MTNEERLNRLLRSETVRLVDEGRFEPEDLDSALKNMRRFVDNLQYEHFRDQTELKRLQKEVDYFLKAGKVTKEEQTGEDNGPRLYTIGIKEDDGSYKVTGYAYGDPWVAQALYMDDIRFDTPEEAKEWWSHYRSG